MARNATKAQVTAKFNKAGIVQPTLKLTPEELQAKLARRAVSFDSSKGKDARSRKNSKARAIAAAY